jgi:hypothetical protein
MFSVVGKRIAEGIGSLKKAVGQNLDITHGYFKDGTLRLSAENSNYRASVIIPGASGKGKVKFGINTQVLLGICNNRDELQFEFPKSSSLLFQATKGKYGGEALTTRSGNLGTVNGKGIAALIDELGELEWLPAIQINNIVIAKPISASKPTRAQPQ